MTIHRVDEAARRLHDAGPWLSTHWGVYRPRVVDGRLQALEPAPWDADPSPIGQGLLDGHDAAARVRRPAVRAGLLQAWRSGRAEPPGPRPRGDEPFVELGWDEALALVAAELQRVKAQHGNHAIFGGSYGWSSAGRFHHAQGQLHRFLNGFGGHVRSLDSYSLGAGRVLMPHIVADMDTLLAQHTAWDVLVDHTRLVLAFGGLPWRNAQVSPGGASEHQLATALRRLARRGVRVINISPLRDDVSLPGRSLSNAEWWPIRPGTDVALMLALAHVLVREGWHDADFLARCTVGFEPLRAHLFGEDDGVPKTPAWAAERCGIDAARIEGLAAQMAAMPTLVNCAYALQRARHGEQPFWMTVALAALLGQIGTPGGGFGLGYGCMNNTGSGRLSFSGPRLPQGDNPVRAVIPVARLVDMLEQPGQPFDYNGQRLHYPDARLVYWAGGNPFHHHQDVNRLRAAWRRPETIIVHEPFWTATARHADVVLPATTPLERDDIGSAASDRYLVAMKAAIAPVGEARDDHAIFAALARRLGFGAAFDEGRSVAGWLAHLWEASRPRAEAAGLQLPDFDRFWREGRLELPRSPRPTVLLAGFRADPQAHPLPTPSGRIEISSARIAAMGLPDCAGHPRWYEPDAAEQAERRRWPLALVSHQPASRLHSQLDHGATSQATKRQGREPLRLHPDEAAARGLADGDVVQVFNARGGFLAGLVLDGGVMPGVAAIATGAWYQPLAPTADAEPGLCAHGNPNLVTPDIGASGLSQGCSAYSTRVQIRRWDRPLPPITVHAPPPGVAGAR